MRRKNQSGVSEIVQVGVHVVRHVIRQVLADVSDDPETSLESVQIGSHKKPALRVDINAEDAFKRELHKYLNGRFKSVKVYGEESLRNPNLDLSSKKEIVVLVDAVDGTDLLERGFSNWCSAAVFFSPQNPRGKRLLAAIVGLPTGEVYYATNESGASQVKGNSKDTPVAGTSNVKSLGEASICFYGQKASNFLSVTKCHFVSKLEQVMNEKRKEPGRGLNTRIYNLAGIPMLLKLIDHRVKHARGVDAVFDLEGQRPHDFVPGAYIAKKAGASVRHLDGKDVSFEEMEDLLLKPAATEIRYVVASTVNLSDELLDLIGFGKSSGEAP